MRWLKEIFKPKLKCLRIGHKEKMELVTIIKRSPEFREVVAEYKAEKKYCSRCGETISVKETEKIQGYTSASFSINIWNDIDDLGYHISR